MFTFSDGCCPKIESYYEGEKDQGLFIMQTEKVNGNCHYVLEGGKWEDGIWMCENSWWLGELSYKGQCKGDVQGSADSKDDSLQWKWVKSGYDADLKFKCVDLCL